jgi:hypothetical protein
MRNFSGTRRATPAPKSAIPPGCLPFLMAAVAYLILGSFSRVTMGQPLWVLIALIALPAAIGCVLSRRSDPKAWLAFGVAFWAVAFYTSINLIRIRIGISSGDSGGNLLAGLVVTLVQGGIAGGVAALAATLRAGVQPKVVQE